MSGPLKEGKSWASAPWALAGVLSLPALLIPIYNPDLFWHLSAGRWMFAHGALPRADWLSFTYAGTPWLDFEWLAQLIFEALYRLGGFFALWLLKGALMLGIWLGLDRAMRINGLPGAIRAAGLCLWSAAALIHADIRPDLFSLVFFAWLLAALEALRLGRLEITNKRLAGAALFFSLWADLHLGFLLGLALIAAYGAAAAFRGQRAAAKTCGRLLACAVAGTLANPYGLGPYEVAWSHWSAGRELARGIAEWQPMSARNKVYWPFWLLSPMFAAGLGAWRRDWKSLPLAPAMAAAGLCLASLMHERTASYFNILGALMIALAARREGPKAERVLSGAVALSAAFLVWVAPGIYRKSFFNYKFVPRTAAEFLSSERAVFEPLRVYNPWEWGGYLGWRLSPRHKVFDDGRYIFHDELPREAAAVADFKVWRDFIASERIDAVLLQNLPTMFPTTKAYPDGSTKAFDRPFYIFYAPLADWALVHWDPAALVFVRRSAVPPSWLVRHEYRYMRPHDAAALAEALRRGEVPKDKVEAEAARYQMELRELERGIMER
ncbi:MAG: hypothetical protein HY077_01580 [Elusimicrobia bacterium]|nr:hypothetical protein [Elusimicrobiota bacterium]